MIFCRTTGLGIAHATGLKLIQSYWSSNQTSFILNALTSTHVRVNPFTMSSINYRNTWLKEVCIIFWKLYLYLMALSMGHTILHVVHHVLRRGGCVEKWRTHLFNAVNRSMMSNSTDLDGLIVIPRFQLTIH